MPRRNKVEALPKAVKAWLDAALLEKNFSEYELLAAELAAKGFSISKSGLHRYGSKFEERMAQMAVSIEQARAVVAASPDDEGAMSEALIRLTQDKLFGVLVELDVDPKKVDLSKLTRSIADLARSSVGQKRWAAEAKAAAREELLREQREKLDAMPNKGGVSAETKAAIREALGIV